MCPEVSLLRLFLVILIILNGDFHDYNTVILTKLVKYYTKKCLLKNQDKLKVAQQNILIIHNVNNYNVQYNYIIYTDQA